MRSPPSRICIALNPETAECFYNRAMAYAALGQTGRALRDYDRALQLNPKLTEAALKPWDPPLSRAALHRGARQTFSGRWTPAPTRRWSTTNSALIYLAQQDRGAGPSQPPTRPASQSRAQGSPRSPRPIVGQATLEAQSLSRKVSLNRENPAVLGCHGFGTPNPCPTGQGPFPHGFRSTEPHGTRQVIQSSPCWIRLPGQTLRKIMFAKPFRPAIDLQPRRGNRE